MARPKKKGLDYFPVDVGIFRDFGLMVGDARFRDENGMGGLPVTTTYLYLLAKIYEENGYYLEMNEDRIALTAKDCGIPTGKVRQVLEYLYSRSLFVEIKTMRAAGKPSIGVTIITSAGIQRRFQEAVKTRAKKNPVEVKEEFWILEERETEPFIKVLPSLNNSGNNSSFSRKNPSNSKKNAIKESKVNKTKEKERKEKESISISPALSYFSDEGVNDAFERYISARRREGEKISDTQVNELIDKLTEMTDDPAARKEIIREATIHNWKSFYPPKKEKRESSGKRRKDCFQNFEQRQYDKSLEGVLLSAEAAKAGIG